MLSKKKIDHYKKLVSEKLSAAGIADKITYKVSKRKLIKNAAFGTIKDEKGEPAKDQGPQYFEVRSEQAVNMHRSLLKKILTLNEQAIRMFLSTPIVMEEPELDTSKLDGILKDKLVTEQPQESPLSSRDSAAAEAKQILARSWLMEAIVHRAKKVGYFEYSAHGQESYDGIEGYCAEDLDATFSLNLLSPRDWFDLATTVWGWIRDSWELRSLSFAAETLPFGFPWRSWAWTITSVSAAMDEAADKLARDRIDIEYGPGTRLHKNEKAYKDYVRYVAEYKQSLTRGKAMRALESSGIVQVSDELWVSEVDPTVLYCDDELVPYDMKDGWSTAKLGDILSLWALSVELEGPILDFRIDSRERPFLQDLAVKTVAWFTRR